MPLQNRVAPDGSLHAVAARGTLLGNRGGRFHRDDKTIGQRQWASRHWICCELHHKNRRHEPMGQGYTSLFFLDEVTALAAGHRPCFFCRRKEATAFLAGERVERFDRRVHDERTAPHPAFGHLLPFLPTGEGGRRPDEGTLADGLMFERDGAFFAKRHNKLLRWSFEGYTQALPFNPSSDMKLLTPPSIAAILQRGYQPRWHPSAEQWDDMT
jgi:hypothetical protein